MDESPREPAQVVRAGESVLDPSLRLCFDHHFPDDHKRRIGERMASYFDDHRSAFDSDADFLYGPYFMSYEKGSYFRAHRDVANHKDDPPRLAAHRWSLLLYLNGRRATGPCRRSTAARSPCTRPIPACATAGWSSCPSRGCCCSSAPP